MKTHRSEVFGRVDDGNAFLPDNSSGGHRPMPADAESFAEEFLASATSGESVNENAEDEVLDDEEGGPFLVLDENGQLPPNDDGDDELETGMVTEETDGPVNQKQVLRGANWAARGA